MRVLVTGGSGFVGSHAVKALVADGHEAHLLARNPEKVRRVIGDGEWVIHPGDIRDAETVRAALDGCDAVLHAAADMGVTGHGTDLHGTNVVGLRNVLGQAAGLGLRPIVHVSTIAVFVPPAEPLITVDSPLASPRNAYGRSKVDGERYARELGGVTIVYPGGITGPGQPKLDALNEGLRAGMRLGWPIVPGGVGVLDVRDLALALARCFTKGSQGSRGSQGEGRYLLGGHFLTWGGLAEVCAEVTGRKVRTYRMPGGVLRGMATAIDALKRVAPIDYPLTRDAADFMLTLVPTDDGPTLKDLDLTLRPVQDTVSDTLRWLSAEGHLDRRRIGRLAR